MNTIASAPSTTFNERIRAEDLFAAFDHYADQIKVLSLDCFDTLLWRDATTPVDAFFDMQQRPGFREVGLSALMRMSSEQQGRTLNVAQRFSNEITLDEIYRYSFPKITSEQLAALAEDELATEKAACKVFLPVVALMRKAHARGIKIIIVSDTYFSEKQLRALLTACLPTDVMAMIDTVFCSSDYGRSKPSGLFRMVLEKIGVPATSILHIGDNPTADLFAARDHNIHALHLVHHNDVIHDMLRMQSVTGVLMDPTIRYSRSLNNPYRRMLSCTDLSDKQPEKLIGYATLGQIMYSFARFLCDEIEALKQAGKNPVVLFIMRDGYLPAQLCEVITKQPVGKKIRISRFASFAASFRSKNDVARYVADVAPTNRFHEISKQLLLPDAVSDALIAEAKLAQAPWLQFTQLVQQPHILEIILQKSAEYRTRLMKYLDKEGGFKAGDTVVFVDLGYTGTTQNFLGPILEEERQVEVTGRYLIALNIPGWKKSRCGLIDSSWCDDRSMRTLVTYIALLEQMSTTNEPSVIDYDEQGSPIFNRTHIHNDQHKKLDQIQSYCFQFARDAERFFSEEQRYPTLEMMRDTALAELSRFLFIPSAAEIKYLQSFKFDLNLGTDDTFSLFNPEEGLSSLRKRGIFTIFMEKNTKTFRTNTPAEMRSAGLELIMTLISHHRFGLELGTKDVNLRHEDLMIAVSKDSQSTQMTIPAQSTHDGYYALNIPIGSGGFNIGVLFGLKYRWVQFHSAEVLDVSGYMCATETLYTSDCWSTLVFGQMEDKGGKLYECLSKDSLAMFAGSMVKLDPKNRYILRIVFRPIVAV